MKSQACIEFKQNLEIHIKSKHEGIKVPCDQCDFKATTKQHLKIHIKSNNLKYIELVKNSEFLLRYIGKLNEIIYVNDNKFPEDNLDYIVN